LEFVNFDSCDAKVFIPFLFFFRFPKNVEILLGKKVTDVAIGAKHVVVATEDNQVFGWGSNEHNQLGSGFPALVSQPTLLCSLRGKSLSGESNLTLSDKNASLHTSLFCHFL
jgi:hypothetical protein